MAFYEFWDSYIPDRMADGITAYINNGRPLGGFLHKVFANDLVGAVGKADDENVNNLKAYAVYLYNEAPMDCWGSEEAVRYWMKVGGLNGLRQQKKEQEA
jgi:hypothetical protein